MRSPTSPLLVALVTVAFAIGDPAVTAAQPRGRSPGRSAPPPSYDRLPGTAARAHGLPFSPRSLRTRDPRLGDPRAPTPPRSPSTPAGLRARHAELAARAERLGELENVSILAKSAAVSVAVGGAIALVASSSTIATIALVIGGLTAAVIPLVAIATAIELAVVSTQRDRLARELAELEPPTAP